MSTHLPPRFVLHRSTNVSGRSTADGGGGGGSTVLLAIGALALGACGGGGAEVCTRDDQCASNFCKADGTCGPASDVDGMPDGLGSDDGTTALCAPNHDGTIDLAELPMAAGKMANFRIATGATFQTQGTGPGGAKTWNLGVQLSGDADKQIALAAPAGAWWAADFPGASYATVLAEGSDLLGVFHIDATGLTLLGVVSPDGGTFSTELTYDPPATILKVPFQAGSTWESTSTISGTAQGVITAYTEKYTSAVDESGTMTTPYGDFPVLRVATDLDRTSGFTLLSSNRTFAWVAECFGPVATVRSQDFETASEFNDPAEVRRLAP